MTQLRESDETSRLGVKHVREIVEQGWGGVIQDIQGPNDRGVDATVFDFHVGRATSLRFDLQIKSSKTKFRADRFLVPIKGAHLSMYRESEVPVILICVDVNPPVNAFWRVVKPGEYGEQIFMSRKDTFGPVSREAVFSAIRRTFPRKVPPAHGQVLQFPLAASIREAARDYYCRKLMRLPHSNRAFGPVDFTWKGWRHITRRTRPQWKIGSSLLLLPCLRAALDGPILPVDARSLGPVRRGSRVQYRTLLTFERVMVFLHRAPTWLRVVIESQSILPVDWAMSTPGDPRRTLSYKFLSLGELSRQVDSRDLGEQK
jgi:hypothetical protein